MKLERPDRGYHTFTPVLWFKRTSMGIRGRIGGHDTNTPHIFISSVPRFRLRMGTYPILAFLGQYDLPDLNTTFSFFLVFPIFVLVDLKKKKNAVSFVSQTTRMYLFRMQKQNVANIQKEASFHGQGRLICQSGTKNSR